MYVITLRPFVSTVCHNYVHFVVAVGNKLIKDPRGVWAIDRKFFGLHPSVNPMPPQLAAVPPVVDLRDERQHTF